MKKEMMLLAGLLLFARECCAMKKFSVEIAKKYMKSKSTLTKREKVLVGGFIVGNSVTSYYFGKAYGVTMNNPYETSGDSIKIFV